MDQLMRRRVRGDLAPLMHALTHRMDEIETIVQLTTVTIQGTSAFHQEMAEQAAETLNCIEDEVDTAWAQGQMSTHKQQAISCRVNAYLHEMLSIIEETDQAVSERVVNKLKVQRKQRRNR